MRPTPRGNGYEFPMDTPFDLIAMGGSLYVTDGNYNRVLKVTSNGTVTTFVDFPGDPTSTGAAAGPDGNLYVAQFGLAPYTPGSGHVDQVAPDGTIPEGAVRNLTTPVDVAFAPDGPMLVLQFETEV